MKTFRKYEKTFRIPITGIDVKGKFCLTQKEVSQLLAGKVVVTEKLDGANTGIFCKNDNIYLQKRRGNIDGSHEQYKRFERWAYENTEKLKELRQGVVYYGELLYCTHSMEYDKLPDWFLVFDIYDLKEERYWDWDEVVKECEIVGLHTVPLLYEGVTTKEHLKSLIKKESAYGPISEGIVVKNYRKQMRGKVVKPEFIKVAFEANDKHWASAKVRYNKLEKGDIYGNSI